VHAKYQNDTDNEIKEVHFHRHGRRGMVPGLYLHVTSLERADLACTSHGQAERFCHHRKHVRPVHSKTQKTLQSKQGSREDKRCKEPQTSQEKDKSRVKPVYNMQERRT
jgi:hypothetical protein